MILLSADRITKSYGADTIFTDVSFNIHKGDRIGIVGGNGAGKTTLLSILYGSEIYDNGKLYLREGVSLGLLKQKDNFISEKTIHEEMLSIFAEIIEMENELASLSQQIAATAAKDESLLKKLLHRYDCLSESFAKKDGYGYQSEIKGILSSMAFPKETYTKKIEELSGGEKTRLSLASLLLRKPDILLLDEPTNHLDIGTRKWLEEYLKTYGGTIILVSHDRYFLNLTAERILEIEDHKLTTYEGNYNAYIEEKQRNRETAERKYLHEKQEIDRQEEIIRRLKQHGTEKLAKRARSRERQLSNTKKAQKPLSENAKIKIRFRQKFRSGFDVLTLRDLSKSFNENGKSKFLFENISFEIKRGERICMVGQNGIGKTTLLRIITGLVTPDSGHMQLGHNVLLGYYDQEQNLLSPENTVLEELHTAYRLYSEPELRILLGRFLFKDDDVFKKVIELSGGEKARLSLLKLMLTGSNFLIMDEPTNHLDLLSKEAFEDALLTFPGTLLLVSHDRYLLNKIPTRILELSEYGIENFLGGYDYYSEKKESIISSKDYLKNLVREDGPTNPKDNAALMKKKERKSNKEREAKRRRREKEIKAEEALIAKIEEEIRTIEAKISLEEVASDYQTLLAHSKELDVAKKSLETALHKWTDLHEE